MTGYADLSKPTQCKGKTWSEKRKVTSLGDIDAVSALV